MSRETVIAITAKFTLAATGFLGVVIFARALGVKGIGKYYAILAASKMIIQVPGAVNGAIKKRISEVDTGNPEYFGLGLMFNFGFVLLLGVVTLAAYPLLRPYLGPRIFGFGMVVVVASLSTFSLVNRVYAATGNPGASFWTDTVRSVLTLGAQVGLLLLGLNVLGLLLGLAGGTFATAVLVYALARIPPMLPTRTEIRRTYEFARWQLPNALLQNMYSRLDVLLLYAIVGSAAVGLYEPALRLTLPATFLAASIGDTLFVKSSGLSSLGREVISDLRNAVSYATLLSVPIFFGSLALSEQLMGVVYGPDFKDGAWALVGLAAFQLFNTYCDPFSSVINGIDRPDIEFKIKFLILLVHAPLAVLLGMEFGLLGVIAATVFSEVVRVGLYLAAGYLLFDEIFVVRLVGVQFAGGVIMYAAVVFLKQSISITGWATLLAVVGAGALVYFVILFALSPHVRYTSKHIVKNILIDAVEKRNQSE